jgi:hypothetical protein
VSYRDYTLARSTPTEIPPPLRLEVDMTEFVTADVWPRQIARIADPVTRNEWVVDLRRFGAGLQVRAVEYAPDGLWMPQVWRDVPRGAEVWFALPHGLVVRAGTRRASATA